MWEPHFDLFTAYNHFKDFKVTRLHLCLLNELNYISPAPWGKKEPIAELEKTSADNTDLSYFLP